MWRVIVHWIDFAAPQAVQAPAVRWSSYEIIQLTIVFLIMYEFFKENYSMKHLVTFSLVSQPVSSVWFKFF